MGVGGLDGGDASPGLEERGGVYTMPRRLSPRHDASPRVLSHPKLLPRHLAGRPYLGRCLVAQRVPDGVRPQGVPAGRWHRLAQRWHCLGEVPHITTLGVSLSEDCFPAIVCPRSNQAPM